MRKGTRSPSLAQDLGALADLYLTVFWLLRRRLYSRLLYQHAAAPAGPATPPAPPTPAAVQRPNRRGRV